MPPPPTTPATAEYDRKLTASTVTASTSPERPSTSSTWRTICSGEAPIAPLGLYSRKRKSLADLKDGDRITLPNDPSNLARALVFLEQNRLIKVKAGVDPLKVTEKDVAENPRKLVLTPIEAAQLPRTLDDAEFALINGNFAISSGLKLTEAVALEKTPDHYLNVVAVKTEDKDKPWARDIVAAFRTPEYRAALDKHFAGYARPAYLQ